MPASYVRDEIGNQGDVAPLTVNVEQGEMGGWEESIQQQANQQEGEQFVLLTAVSSYTIS